MNKLQYAKEQLETAKQLKEEGKYQASIDVLEEIVPVFEEVEDWEGYVEGMNLWNNNLVKNGKYDVGIERGRIVLKRALETLGKSHLVLATSYDVLGFSHKGKHELESSIYYHQKALTIRMEILGKKHPDIALSYTNIGNCYDDGGNYNSSFEYYNKALEIRLFSLGENHLDIATSYNGLGICYWRKGDFDKAIQFHDNALGILLKTFGTKHINISSCYDNLGICYHGKGDCDKAVFFQNKALEIKQSILGDRHPNVAQNYNNMGVFCLDKGDHDGAILFQIRALGIQLITLGEKHPETAGSYNNLGLCYLDKRNFDKAIQFHKKALGINLATLGKTHPNVAHNYNNLGMCYYDKGNYDNALQLYKKALELILLSFGDNHLDTAASNNNIGLCHNKKGNYSEAIQYCQKALEIRKLLLGKKHPHIAANYNNLGLCHSNKGLYKKAIQYYQLALQGNVMIYNNCAFCHNPDLQDYLTSKYLPETFKSKSLTLHALYKKENNLKHLQAALFTAQVAVEWVNYIRQSFSNEGSKLTLAQNAYDIYKNGIKIAKHAAQVAQKKPNRWRKVTEEIAQINHDSWPKDKLNYCFTAEDCLHTAFDFCEKSRAMVLLGNIKGEEAKGRALIPEKLLQKEYDLKVELNYYDKKIKQEEYKKEEEQNQKGLMEWHGKFFDYKQEYDTLIEQLEKDYPDYYALKYEVKTASVGDLQQTLYGQADTMLLQYFIGDENLYIFAITANNYKTYELPKPNDFEELAKDFVHWGIRGKINYNDYLAMGHELYQLLIAPVFNDFFAPEKKTEGQEDIFSPFGEMSEGQRGRLIIIPDGVLAQLPFEALLTQAVTVKTEYADLPYLIKGFEISYHFSASLWQRSVFQKREGEPAPPDVADFIGFAPVYVTKPDEPQWKKDLEAELGIDEGEAAKETEQTPLEAVPANGTRSINIGDAEYPALLYSENEVNDIAQLFKTFNKKASTHLHQSATVQNFMAKSKHCKYVLVSAHADFQVERPDLTGIIFSPEAEKPKTAEEELWDEFKIHHDHILYLSDAYNLRLQHTDLVVLSCCETGIGKEAVGEGIMALNRGFLYAGASNVIYTLFKIYDKESGELTQKLFQHILDGKSYRQALRQAKLDMIARGSRPVFWSGYVLVGA